MTDATPTPAEILDPGVHVRLLTTHVTEPTACPLDKWDLVVALDFDLVRALNVPWERLAEDLHKVVGTYATGQRVRACLNVGSGDKVRQSTEQEHWINLDMLPLDGVDVVRDLRRGLPFDDKRFDYLLCDNVLEHFDSEDAIFLINEMDRVLKVGGRLDVIVPHGQSQGAWQDPTHRSAWVPRSCLYWNQTTTPYGGKRVGIEASLYVDPAAGVEEHGDIKTESFLIFHLIKGTPAGPAR
jgi:SAM-dependent methyltransferase